ncbi:DUF4422 domain-containing protein [Pectinatus frisingensis]|uniref:DUF4422 domain-containing protein n=1 Tax=Pectinatus frisingensis TaxID=865 RepID=UPI0018C67B51|nr:DUF4422 domain-containing protein [Pectinatus frisingensis]
MNIKILIALHKPYWVVHDEAYMPIQAGKKLNKDIGFKGDDTGENISDKNRNYCELTAIYWAWKNLEADYIGLVHYRRYFTKKSLLKNKKNSVLKIKDWVNLLNQYDIVLPKKRNYYIETNYSHYAHAHYGKDLDKTREVIKQLFPEYEKSFEKVMNKRTAHMFNMFVMKKDKYDRYCQWLFTILFALESQIDISGYNKTEARVFGYISELLLDVWLNNQKLSYKEINVTFMEKQNWLKKGFIFLKRKFYDRGYKVE